MHLTWAAKCQLTLTRGILTVVVVTVKVVLQPSSITIFSLLTITLVMALTVTAVNDGFRDTREVGGNVGHQYRHVCRVLNSLNP